MPFLWQKIPAYRFPANPQRQLDEFKSRAELKSVQASLGSWHDHHQWCLRAESERDLLEIASYWQVASEQALADAELKLASLLDHLEKDLSKFKD